MAPHGEAMISSYSRTNNSNKPPRLSVSNDGLKRTVSDISFELSKEAAAMEMIKDITTTSGTKTLPAISEVEDAKCECCGMSEECTPEYINRVRDKFSGKWICGLCGEAVKEEVEKNGGKKEEALSAHMSACVRFNKLSRAYPVLYQAEAMRELLKKNTTRSKSFSPREKKAGGSASGSGIMRSSSCIPAITKEMNDFTISK